MPVFYVTSDRKFESKITHVFEGIDESDALRQFVLTNKIAESSKHRFKVVPHDGEVAEPPVEAVVEEVAVEEVVVEPKPKRTRRKTKQ
jgi:hypothetical protein